MLLTGAGFLVWKKVRIYTDFSITTDGLAHGLHGRFSTGLLLEDTTGKKHASCWDSFLLPAFHTTLSNINTPTQAGFLILESVRSTSKFSTKQAGHVRRNMFIYVRKSGWYFQEKKKSWSREDGVSKRALSQIRNSAWVIYSSIYVVKCPV